MTANTVIAHAADEIERWPAYRVRELRGGAGPAVYTALFESATHLYVWPAVHLLQKHLGAKLRSGQLQHWRQTNHDVVVNTLREAAEQPPPADLEVQTLRAKLAEFHMELAQGMGLYGYDVATLVRETVAEVERLRRENDRLSRELEETRRQAVTERGVLG